MSFLLFLFIRSSIMIDDSKKKEAHWRFISNFRTAIQSIVASIYSVFLGLIIGVQQQMQYTSDTFNKLSGAMTVGGSVLTGTRDLGTSVVNGPPGQIMRAVGSVCFHENTLVKKNDNKTLDATLPENHPKKELANKKTKFIKNYSGGKKKEFIFLNSALCITLAKTGLLYPKNAGA